MKIKRTIKDEVWGYPMKHAGFTEIINEDKMKSIICRTLLGELDTYEVDPDSIEVPKKNRPWGSVVAMRQLRETGKIETLSSTYELVKA